MTTKEYIQVFEEHRMLVFFFCWKYLKQREDAEDITSALFITLWDHRSDVPVDKAKAFLMVSAKNRCFDKIKTDSNSMNRIIAYTGNLDDTVEIKLEDPYEEIIHAIYIALENKLTPRQRQMFTMHMIEGKTYNEIASILNVSSQTVANTIFHALERIRGQLKDQKVAEAYSKRK